ncbi:ORF1337 [White spot syndrome virus]|uniref:ORF1337 n=1 Tax=White spot syndrome virus TaxID=342409 RepID=A0A2D3I5F8_9VIRU|nr:ORF1337 [White spot syndrome virus]
MLVVEHRAYNRSEQTHLGCNLDVCFILLLTKTSASKRVLSFLDVWNNNDVQEPLKEDCWELSLYIPPPPAAEPVSKERYNFLSSILSAKASFSTRLLKKARRDMGFL